MTAPGKPCGATSAIAWATRSTSRSAWSTRLPGRATASSGAWYAMSDLTAPRASESRGARGQLAYDPGLLRVLRRLWSACPEHLRRALLRTGVPYLVAFLARYRRAHSLANFAGSLPELKADYRRGPAERRPALSVRFDAIVDALVLPNGVRKTTYSRRQEEVLARVLAHEGCKLNGREIRVLDIPSSAGTDSLRSYTVIRE